MPAEDARPAAPPPMPKRLDQTSLVDRTLRGAIAWTRGDLALAYGATRLHLPALVAALVFLSGLVLAGTMLLADAAQRWSAGLAGTVTVEIPAALAGEALTAEERLARVQAVLARTPGIARAAVLPPERVRALLAPWMEPEDLAGLPLPMLIDVSVAPGASIDLAALNAALEAAVPGTRADDHRRWLVGLERLASLAVGVALLLVAVVAAATAGAVAFATRAGLALHEQAIDLLHLIGAPDGYIARQFSRRALVMGLVGGAAGWFAAVLAIAAIAGAAQAIDPAVAPSLPGSVAIALPLLAFVPAAGLVAMASAHWTVRRALARLP